MKAKNINTWCIVGAIVWTLGGTILKAIFPNIGISINDIIKVGFTLVGLVGGITGSIWLDKIKDMIKKE